MDYQSSKAVQLYDVVNPFSRSILLFSDAVLGKDIHVSPPTVVS